MMNFSDKIYVAGHCGLAGSAIVRALKKAGYTNLVCCTHQALDLTQQAKVNDFFKNEKPDHVFIAAAKVGGIHANNTYRGEFIYNNLAITLNIVEAAKQYGVKRLLFLGSSCIYPREGAQPMQETALLTGPLESTNEPYAVAKIAGVKLCEAYNAQYDTDFFSVIPASLYGPHDNFDLQTSHVLPALMRKIHEAKVANQPSITVWGTGIAKREFLYVDEMAEACLFLMNKTGFRELINIGTGVETSIRELIETLCEVIGYQGEVIYDTSKPDGMPRKLLDTARLSALGWQARMPLQQGLHYAYDWFLANKAAITKPVNA